MTTERAPPTASHWRRHNLIEAAERKLPSEAETCEQSTLPDLAGRLSTGPPPGQQED